MGAITPGAEFVEIKDPSSADFEAFFRIYEEALPESERKSRGQVAEFVTRADYHVVAMKSEAQVLSFLIVFMSLDHEVGLLEYMATARGARNRGLGADMFKKAAEIAGERPLLVEVDSEREDSPDRETRSRRKNFYLRAGCQQIEGLDYLMPRVDGAEPPMMDLLYYWKGCSTVPSHDLIRGWIETVYAEVYQRPTDDPAIEWMMSGLIKRGPNPA
jgi:GNAT superfamily N-acetyltransferase